MFDHKQIHMYTWERMEGKSIIDLFLVDQRNQSQVIDTLCLGVLSWEQTESVCRLAQLHEMSKLGVELSYKKLEA